LESTEIREAIREDVILRDGRQVGRDAAEAAVSRIQSAAVGRGIGGYAYSIPYQFASAEERLEFLRSARNGLEEVLAAQPIA